MAYIGADIYSTGFWHFIQVKLAVFQSSAESDFFP